MLGSVFAIAIVKQVFGGLGHNFMNPAAAARVFLVTAFGVQMTNWPVVADAVSNATPLAILKGLSTDPLPSVTNMLIGNHGGCIGETCAIALVLGGVYLLVRRVITWHIPVAFIGTVEHTYLRIRAGRPHRQRRVPSVGRGAFARGHLHGHRLRHLPGHQ